jgi:hypothetical protein
MVVFFVSLRLLRVFIGAPNVDTQDSPPVDVGHERYLSVPRVGNTSISGWVGREGRLLIQNSVTAMVSFMRSGETAVVAAIDLKNEADIA